MPEKGSPFLYVVYIYIYIGRETERETYMDACSAGIHVFVGFGFEPYLGCLMERPAG